MLNVTVEGLDQYKVEKQNPGYEENLVQQSFFIYRNAGLVQ